MSISKKSIALAVGVAAVLGGSALAAAPSASARPGVIGHIDDAWVHSNGQLYVAGWACNPTTVPTQRIRIIDYPNGGTNWDWDASGPLANGYRPDVAKVHPDCGTHTGFTSLVGAGLTTHPGAKICIVAFDDGTPLDPTDIVIGCTTAIAHN